MTQLVCTRKLYGVGKDSGKVTEVSLLTPFFSEEEGNWVCEVQFADPELVSPFAGRGVDAFQSLIVAIQGIGRYLDESGINWAVFETPSPEEGSYADDGFPRYLPTIYGAEFRRELECLVDREVRKAREDGRAGAYLARAGLRKPKPT